MSCCFWKALRAIEMSLQKLKEPKNGDRSKLRSPRHYPWSSFMFLRQSASNGEPYKQTFELKWDPQSEWKHKQAKSHHPVGQPPNPKNKLLSELLHLCVSLSFRSKIGTKIITGLVAFSKPRAFSAYSTVINNFELLRGPISLVGSIQFYPLIVCVALYSNFCLPNDVDSVISNVTHE